MRKLEALTAQRLLENPLEKPGWVVEGLIPCGLTLVAGDPKIGKSWLGLDLALHVALGEPFWGFATKRGTVLYLCLEDTFSRVQARLQHLCDEANDNLCCVVEAECIGNGLMEQLGEFADGHDDLKMAIIDTFQTVRTPSSQTIYSADYEDVGRSRHSPTRGASPFWRSTTPTRWATATCSTPSADRTASWAAPTRLWCCAGRRAAAARRRSTSRGAT